MTAIRNYSTSFSVTNRMTFKKEVYFSEGRSICDVVTMIYGFYELVGFNYSIDTCLGNQLISALWSLDICINKISDIDPILHNFFLAWRLLDLEYYLIWSHRQFGSVPDWCPRGTILYSGIDNNANNSSNGNNANNGNEVISLFD